MPRFYGVLLLAVTLLAVPSGYASGDPEAPLPGAGSAAVRHVPLIDAVRAGDIRKVQRLIAANVDVNEALFNGFTALHMAAQTGQTDIARRLIEAGADVNAAALDKKVTPLYIAAEKGHDGVAALLLAKGAKVNYAAVAAAVVHGRDKILELFFQHGANIERTDANGTTYLHLAALSGRADIVDLLIKYGAKVDARDKDGLTPLSVAVGDKRVTAALRRHGAKVSPRPDWKTLMSTGDMAYTRDDYETARAKYELALADLMQRPQKASPAWRLMLLQKLAFTYMQTDQTDKARRAAGEFFDAYTEDTGLDSLNMAAMATLLGQIYDGEGDYAKAEKYYRTAVGIDETKFKLGAVALTHAYLRLANALIKQRKYAHAQAAFERAIRSIRNGKRADPVILGLTEQNLAHALRFQGELAQAEELYKRSNALLDKAPGDNRALAAGGVYGLADIARRRGQLRKAAGLYEKAIAAYQSSRDSNPDTLKAVKSEYRRLRRQLSRPPPGR